MKEKYGSEMKSKLLLKKVGIEYLEVLADLRIEFIKDMHPEYENEFLTELRKATINYFSVTLKKDSYIGFIGENSDGEITCTAGLLIYHLPPLTSSKPRKFGHVLNFYTRPNHRKKGYGRELIEYMKTTARLEGIDRLVLNATKMGYKLYKKASFFEPEDMAMILDL